MVSLQLFLNAGSIVATGVNKAFSTRTSAVGWKTVTGIQFIFPIRKSPILNCDVSVGITYTVYAVIVIFTCFIPSSPRWLLSKDREEEAIAALRRLRNKEEVANGNCEAEVQAIREALQEHVHKAPWTDLVRGTNLRRTMLVVVFYFFQQASLD